MKLSLRNGTGLLLAFASAGFLLWAKSSAADPAWWSAPQTSIKEPGAVAHDYSPANLGQLKNVATKAKTYLDSILAAAGGAGPEVNAICSFTDEGNYSPVNLGQLKNVAKPFYDRMAQIRYNWRTGTAGVASPLYPWRLTVGPENAAPANLGQLKNVFSFAPSAAFLSSDGDGDSLPSWWETLYGLNPAQSNDGLDTDHDQLSDADEYFLNLHYGMSCSPVNPLSQSHPGLSDYEASLVVEEGYSPSDIERMRRGDPHLLAEDPQMKAIHRGIDDWESTDDLPPGEPAGDCVTWLYSQPITPPPPTDVAYVSAGPLSTMPSYLKLWPTTPDPNEVESYPMAFFSGRVDLGHNGGVDENAPDRKGRGGDLQYARSWLRLSQPVNFPVKRRFYCLTTTDWTLGDAVVRHKAILNQMDYTVPAAGPSTVEADSNIIDIEPEIMLNDQVGFQQGTYAHVGHCDLCVYGPRTISPPNSGKPASAYSITPDSEGNYLAAMAPNHDNDQLSDPARSDIDSNRAVIASSQPLSQTAKDKDDDFVKLCIDTTLIYWADYEIVVSVTSDPGTKVFLYDAEGEALPAAPLVYKSIEPGLPPRWVEHLFTDAQGIFAEIGQLTPPPGSAPAPTLGKATINFTLRFPDRLPDGTVNPAPAVWSKKVVLQPVALQSVTFSGAANDEFFTVKADDGTDFAAPHWKDTGGDGNLVKTEGDHTYPVAFVRKKIPQVAATIKLTPGLTGVRIKASHPEGFSMTTAPLTVPAGGIIEIPATTLARPLPGTVFHYPAFKLTWEISVNGGPWGLIGESRTPLYVLRRIPNLGVDDVPGAVAATEMRYTLVHKSCTLAQGQLSDRDIISSMNAEFSVWQARRLRYDAQTGAPASPPEPIYFYKNWETSDPANDILRVNILLARPKELPAPSCQCYVFCEMFRDMLKIQGIPARAPIIAYNWDGLMGYRRFLVKNWSFKQAGTSGVTGWPYSQANDEYEYIGGLLAQNNDHGPGVFDNHCLLLVPDGSFYDPSYGTGPHDNLMSHDWAAFSGYERIQNGYLDPVSAARKNVATSEETKIYTYR